MDGNHDRPATVLANKVEQGGDGSQEINLALKRDGELYDCRREGYVYLVYHIFMKNLCVDIVLMN